MLVRTNRSHWLRFAHLVAWILSNASAVFAQQAAPARKAPSSTKSGPSPQNAARSRAGLDVQSAADRLLKSVTIKCATDTTLCPW
jgi:hypothetical protein